MDLATRLFQFSFGVEPNKATLQNLASTLNDYVASLAEKQKALEAYALTAKPEQFLSSTPLSGSEKQKLLEQYVKSNQGKQELEREIKKQKKAARQPILWQIPEEKMKELQWKRTQLLRLQAEQAKKKNGAAIAGKGAKVVQGPVKKVQPKGLANGKPVKPSAPKLPTKPPSVASTAASKPSKAPSKAPTNAAKSTPLKTASSASQQAKKPAPSSSVGGVKKAIPKQ
ncbi:MAG: hypothetical protein LQ351_002091 [Letrouitia transgressa]|nr:MAG: hypothetical protein LQ351_002091 [Letrouitia transgressa]